MIFYIFFIFVLSPIIEWFLHYMLHFINNSDHYKHHKNITKNILDKNHVLTLEVWPIIPIVFCLYFRFYACSYIFLRYYVIHTLIHFYPNICPKLTNHHMTHHKYSKYNYCVTSIWPDKLLGTFYEKKNNDM